MLAHTQAYLRNNRIFLAIILPPPPVSGGSTLAVKVSVPVVLLVCVLLAAVVVGVVLSKPLYRRCKSKRQYNFQRMRFRAQSDVLENDGDGGE